MMEKEIGDDDVDGRTSRIRKPFEDVGGDCPERLAIDEMDLHIPRADPSEHGAHEGAIAGADFGDRAQLSDARELASDDARITHEHVDAHEVAARACRARIV